MPGSGGEGNSAGLGHQATGLEVGTALAVEVSPVATSPARRKPLCQSTVADALAGGVNPAETERLLHHIQVGDGIGARCLASVAGYPASFLRSRKYPRPSGILQ